MKNKKMHLIKAGAFSFSILFFGIMGCEDNNNPNSAPLTESSSSVVTGVESSSSVVTGTESSSSVVTGTESSSSVVTSVSSKIIFSCTSIDDGEQICVDYDGFEEYTFMLPEMADSCEADGGIATTTSCSSEATLSCILDKSEVGTSYIHFYNPMYSQLTCDNLKMTEK